MLSSFVFQLPTKIYYGCGELLKIADRVREVGAGNRILIVTDQVVGGAPFMETLLRDLKENGFDCLVYSGAEPNPAVRHVREGLNLANRHRCDLIIGIGGGSSLDAAKAIAIMARNPGEIGDYWGNPPQNKALPLIAIPTTAGTSSELTWVTVIKDEERKVKMGIGSPKLAPTMAIYDPEITVSVPAGLTASIGMDTLTHAIEAYINKNNNPVAELAALEAIRLVGENLRTAVSDGKNLEARQGMLLATLFAGIAFANIGLGVVHAITAIMGGFFPVSHGVINAILLPPCMDYNLEACTAKYARIAMALGEQVDGLSERAAAEKAVAAVFRLSRDVGIPARLSEVGVSAEHLEEIVQSAMKNVNIPINPRRPGPEDLLAICRQVI